MSEIDSLPVWNYKCITDGCYYPHKKVAGITGYIVQEQIEGHVERCHAVGTREDQDIIR